ncbi:MAG: hypothetical protein DI551_07710 [Micavibrio aeruginosavorus]|uniref:Uncharacterized protein n=1 Tax=Micavibrio aeruginosavorus TaxID=349221 RepID=A0A2W5MVQ5_9BACT|nr:MAG: hypothetical protein DI551_07710 [Micavibrio aeruginosavorus]
MFDKFLQRHPWGGSIALTAPFVLGAVALADVGPHKPASAKVAFDVFAKETAAPAKPVSHTIPKKSIMREQKDFSL